MWPQPGHPNEIEVDRLRVEKNATVICDQTFMSTPTGYLSDLVQAPAERRPRIVWDLPEQIAKMISPHRACDDSQIGEQCACLLRSGQWQRLAIPCNAQFAQHADLKPIAHEPTGPCQWRPRQPRTSTVHGRRRYRTKLPLRSATRLEGGH